MVDRRKEGRADGGANRLLSPVRRVLRSGFAGLAAGLATYLGLCVGALIVYSVVFPPLTGVQLQRHVEAAWRDRPAPRHYAPVPMSQIAPVLPRAVVAAEDSRFFTHAGIDWQGVQEAIAEYRRGEGLRGASGIPQQLVKNLFMTTHSTWLRKALEVPLAYAADLILPKQRMLELYLNVAEWGPGVFGAEAAARHHYGTSASALTRPQAAALAACLPNPLARRPQTVGWYRDIILRRMENLDAVPLPPSLRHPSPPAAPPPKSEPPPVPPADTAPPPDSTASPDSAVPPDSVAPSDSAPPPDSTTRFSW